VGAAARRAEDGEPLDPEVIVDRATSPAASTTRRPGCGSDSP
jgi:hypothetical protein